MRSVNADSAASPDGRKWDQIDWPTVHRRVRRLQTRIAKATRDRNWRRVKALQRFLVNSFSAKALAAKRVSENDGKRTPGVDGEIWSTPEAKWQAIQRLGSRGLRPQPLRRVYIPKRGSNTKMRPLGIPAMIDRAQQALHLQGLEPVAETQADPHSYGFRRGRGTQDAIARVFTLLAVDGDSKARNSGERRGLTTGAPVGDLGDCWFVDVVYGVIEARSAAIGGRSSDPCFLVLDFAPMLRRTIPA